MECHHDSRNCSYRIILTLKLIYRILLIAVTATIGQLLLPWWWVAPLAAFVVEVVFGKGDRLGFFSGFYGIAIPWMILAFYIDHQNGSVLAQRVLGIFSLPQFGLVLVLVTGLIGGLAGGVSSLAGSWVKAYWIHER